MTELNIEPARKIGNCGCTHSFEHLYEQPTITCGKKCPTCGKPCRGYSGHDGSHQCNQHHTW